MRKDCFVRIKGDVLTSYLILGLLGLFIGVVVSLAVSGLSWVILYLGEIRMANWFYLLPFLPLVAILIQKSHQQIEVGLLVMAKLIREDLSLPFRFMPFILSSALLAHLFGASVGRTGVSVQFGAAIAYWICYHLRTKATDTRLFVLSGLAAGFASLFQSPLAAMCFVWEVFSLERWSRKGLFLTLIASTVSSFVASYVGVPPLHYDVTSQLPIRVITVAQVILLGLGFGVVGNGFAVLVTFLKTRFTRYYQNRYFIILALSSFLTFLLWWHQGRYSGLGVELVPLISGQDSYYYDWFFKLLLTALTVTLGFQGGEVSPLFAIGASLGFILAPLTDLPTDLVVSFGYLSVFAGATNLFLTPLVLATSLFGFHDLPFFVICIGTASYLTRRYSIYPNITFMKSRHEQKNIQNKL